MSDFIPSTPEDTRPQARYRGRQFEQAADESFRKVNPLAITSLAFGVLSILIMFSWLLFFLPIISIVCSVIALRQIRAAFAEMTGRGFAIAGLACAIVLGCLGLYLYVYVISNEVPLGYTALSWDDLQLTDDNHDIPEAIKELDGKRVYISGYMYPGRQNINIQEFTMVRLKQHCKFCARALKSTEVVQVEMTGELLAKYSLRRTGVGGILRVRPMQARNPRGGFPYLIEADYLYQP